MTGTVLSYLLSSFARFREKVSNIFKPNFKPVKIFVLCACKSTENETLTVGRYLGNWKSGLHALKLLLRIINLICCWETMNLLKWNWRLFCHFSGEGSQPSGTSEDTNLSSMARAIQVHPDANNVMYFAWWGFMEFFLFPHLVISPLQATTSGGTFGNLPASIYCRRLLSYTRQKILRCSAFPHMTSFSQDVHCFLLYFCCEPIVIRLCLLGAVLLEVYFRWLG